MPNSDPKSDYQLDSRTSPHGPKMLKGIGIAVFVGLLVVFLNATQSKDIASIISFAFTGALLGGASLLLGGTIGFLFGIPRTTQENAINDVASRHGERAGQRNDTIEYNPNTNLEQISDWLTKMLVGVGLTQLPSIPHEMGKLQVRISPAFGGETSSGIFGLSVLVYFAIAGFLFGYLWTRLYLATALRQADIERIESRVVEALQKTAKSDAEALNLVYRQLNADKNGPNVDQEVLNNAISAASDSVREQIFTQAWRVRRNNWRQNQELMARSIPVFRGLLHSSSGKAYHETWGQLGFALKDMSPPQWSEAEKIFTHAIELRGKEKVIENPFYELNRAICRIMQDESFANNNSSNSADKMKIIDDLSKALKGGVESETLEDASITKWMEINEVKLKDLIAGDSTSTV